ncbi:MAG: TetR/AcrR family transcriptional regulator [Planctomycetes bacterium]|jgi:TetR/AcrR family transcriptional repressor of mexJK operon|nr:TetR/AcrR family transcriptional regulator [Planctomycetota bacterium]
MADENEPKPKGRPKDPGKRTSILHAARSLFLEHGLAVVSMDAIAEQAGVSKATVYSHYADKSSLFRAVLEAETGDYSPPPQIDKLEKLEDLRQHLVDFGSSLVLVLTRPGVVDLGRLLVNEAHRHPDQATHFFARGPEATHLMLAAMLSKANEQQLIACDNCKLASDHLLSMWLGQRHLRQQLGLCPPPTSREVRRHVAACVDVILAAFACNRSRK